MIKNIKLAIGFGVLFWLIIFVVMSILIFTSAIKDNQYLLSIFNWLVDGGAAYFLARFYFKRTPGTFRDGIILGIFWLAISSVLDMAITIPLFIKNHLSKLFNIQVGYVDAAGYFFSNWLLWVGFLVIVVATAVAAYLMSEKSAGMPPTSARPPRPAT